MYKEMRQCWLGCHAPGSSEWRSLSIPAGLHAHPRPISLQAKHCAGDVLQQPLWWHAVQVTKQVLAEPRSVAIRKYLAAYVADGLGKIWIKSQWPGEHSWPPPAKFNEQNKLAFAELYMAC